MSDSERLQAEDQGGSANSGMIKKVFIGLVVIGLIYIGYNVIKKTASVPEPPSAAERSLENIKKKQSNLDKQAADATISTAPTPTPQGDQNAQKMLQDLQAKKEAEERLRRDAEEQAQMALEELNYQRKIQSLPHEPPLADAWVQRMQKAQASNQNVSRRELTSEEEAILKEKNPALIAALKAAKAKTNLPGNARPYFASGAPQQVADKGGKAANAPGVALPASIDPHTGLPVNASQEGISGLLPDGTPDIEGGAIPVQITYVPVGATQPVTVTRWVRPGYLNGRSRPYNPQELIEADKMWRTSLRAPSEVEFDKNAGSVKIPLQPTGNRVRVVSDWQFVQRYVTVLPNPKGKLSPPNPPQP